MTVRNSLLGRTDAKHCARAVPSGPVKALLFGVAPDPSAAAAAPATAENALLENLARTPMRLVDLDPPGFLLPDWVVTRPRLTGICGSDSKQVFMDWGDVASPDNPMKGFFSLPQVLGHEVVADVVELGPEARGLEVGDRVVLNPWLSCAPRGVRPVCAACAARRLQPVCLVLRRADRARHPHRYIERRERRLGRVDARA